MGMCPAATGILEYYMYYLREKKKSQLLYFYYFPGVQYMKLKGTNITTTARKSVIYILKFKLFLGVLVCKPHLKGKSADCLLLDKFF